MVTSVRWMRRLTMIAAALLAAPGFAQVDGSFADEPAYMARLAHRSMLLDGAVKPSGGLVVVGERGHILLSDDDGRNWSQSPVPTRSLLTSVFFVDDDNGWAVGHDAVILRTTDGGASWTKVYFDPEDQRPLFGVLFTDAERGIAVGAYGLYMTSDDGGLSWQTENLSPVRFSEELHGENAGEDDPDSAVESSPDDEEGEEDYEDEFEFFDYHLNHITSDSSGRLYIAAEAGHFFRSEDGGETWLAMNPPYEGSYYATVPLGGDRLLVCGMRGHLLRSEDAGATLEEVDTGTLALLSGGAIMDDSTVLVVGMAGTVLVSTDNGQSFTLAAQPDRTGLSTVLIARDGATVLLGEAGVERRAASDFIGGEQ